MADAESHDTPIPLGAGERPPVPGAVKIEVLDDGVNHHHSARTKARKVALDLLYDADVTGRHPLDLLDEADKVRPLTRELVTGVADDVRDIDRRIERSMTGEWTLARMPAIDRALARMACWELSHTETPAAAVISEAVALADEYSTDGSAGFLSSLLGTVAQQVTAPETVEDTPVSWLDAEAAGAPASDEMTEYLQYVPEALQDVPEALQDATQAPAESWLDAEAAGAPSAEEMAAYLHDIPSPLNADD